MSSPQIQLATVSFTASGAPLTVEEKFLWNHMTYPYGIHGAQVRIDRDTGDVAVERIYVAYEVGRAVNPVLVDGQIAGGAAQGLGGVLDDATYQGHWRHEP